MSIRNLTTTTQPVAGYVIAAPRRIDGVVGTLSVAYRVSNDIPADFVDMLARLDNPLARRD